MSGDFAPFGNLTPEARPGDWKIVAEAQKRRIERMKGVLHEMKLAMLGYPAESRTLTSTQLLAAIRYELGESAEFAQDSKP